MDHTRPDRNEIDRFVREILRQNPRSGYLLARCIFPGSKKPLTEFLDLGALSIDVITARLHELAQIGAAGRAMVAVSSTTFMRGADQTLAGCEAHVHALLAMTVELDNYPTAGLQTLRETLGEPDLIVESGGLFENPTSSAIENRIHAYFLFEEPITQSSELKRAKEAKKRLAQVAGGDPANNPLSHLLRLPGSVHFKGEPRLCQVVGGSAKWW